MWTKVGAMMYGAMMSVKGHSLTEWRVAIHNGAFLSATGCYRGGVYWADPRLEPLNAIYIK